MFRVSTWPSGSIRRTESYDASVGAETYSTPSGDIARWNAAVLDGTVANVSVRPPGSIRNTVPARSPTYNEPSRPNARPHATPRSDAITSYLPSSNTRYTRPSKRLDT